MSREEAIAFGKRVIDLGFKGETQTFCELAIESLKWQEEFMNKVYEQNQEAEFYINGRRFRVREVPQ